MRNILIPLILLMWGCSTPEQVIQQTLDNTFRRDSMTIEFKPQVVYKPASKDTVYRVDTVIIRDSVKVPVIERLESKDGKTKIMIDRRDLNKIYGIVEQQDDSIKTLVREVTYFKEEERYKTETKTVESNDFFDGVTLMGILYVVGGVALLGFVGRMFGK